jgi:YidC/Oxa1 family membrane protein insertase
VQLIGTLFNYIFQEPAYNLIMAIYGIVHSFPWAIVLMTLVVRTALIPLFRWQLRSSLAMQKISPELQRIQREYRSEPARMQQETMKLYRENGVNPASGCLPLLVQLPILWGLYGAFRLILGSTGNTVSAIQKSLDTLNGNLYPFVKGIFFGGVGLQHLPDPMFFGINLANPDHTFILPILATVATFIQIRMSMARTRAMQAANKPASGPDPNSAAMGMMQWLMPVITLFAATRFPAGLALYWTISTTYTIGQQYFVNGRNWGGLLPKAAEDWLVNKGWIKPQTIAVPAVVDSTLTSSKGQRGKVTVAEEPMASEKPAPRPGLLQLLMGARPQADLEQLSATPESANGHKANGARPAVKKSADDSSAAVVKNGQTANGAKPAAPKPATAGPRPASAKKDAVRLVTGTAGGGTAPGTVVRAPTAPVTRAAVPATNRPKSGPSKSSTARHHSTKKR